MSDPWASTAEGEATVRTRMLVGVCLAAVGAFFAFDAHGRLRLFLEVLNYWWVGTAVLAGLVVLQLVPNLAARLLVGLLVALTLLGVVGPPALNWNLIAGLLSAGVGVTGFVLALAGTHSGQRYICALWLRHNTARRSILPEQTSLLCVAAGLTFDMCSATLSGGQTLRIRLLAADVTVVIPREWSCHVVSAHTRGVRVRDLGQIPEAGPVLNLEISGSMARLSIRRV